MKKNKTMDIINRYAGNYRFLILMGRLLSALSALLMLVPYYDIWRIIRIAVSGNRYDKISGIAWQAVGITISAMLIYYSRMFEEYGRSVNWSVVSEGKEEKQHD